MSCSKNNIDLRPIFINTFNKLHNYAILTNNPNSNLYEPSNDIYGDRILINQDNFTSNITNNIDLEDINGNEDIIDNKDNIFIIDNKNVYENCAITTSIPWYSTNNKFNKCEIPDIITLDDNNILKMNDDKKTISYNFKSSNKNAAFCSHYKNVNKAYCENSWYDWLIIPNFYLGNTYFKDIGKYKENDVYKCYKPCDGDYIPFTNNKNEKTCIPKNLYSGGLLMNKYKYSALGLINLIGNITSTGNNSRLHNLTYINYYLIFYYKHNNNIDNNIYQPNQIYNDIINTSKDDIEFGRFKSNIDNIEAEFIQAIKNEIIDYKNFDNSLNQNYDNLNVFSYKSVEFQETTNDLFSLNGLEYNNILIDPILIHIWILANLYRPYTKEDLTKMAPKTNGSDISNTELYDLLLINKFDNDNSKNINITIRLKNIFFRAVNVCYNNKTIFSTNIINRTKKALQNKSLIDLILDKEFYINTDLKDNNSEKYLIFSNKTKFTNFLNDLTLLDNFQEINYYKDADLSELVYNITDKKDLIKNIIGDFGMKNNTDNQINGENNRFKYLFSIEYLEASNICKLNELYNPVTGLCNPRPPITVEVKKQEDNIDNIDDEFKIPQMKYFITLFIQVVFVIIIGYVFYLFYNIFGEVIFATINLIYETIEEAYYGYSVGRVQRRIDNVTVEQKTKKADMIQILQYDLSKEKEDNDNIKRKIDEIDSYIKENRLDEEDEEL